MDSLLVRLPGSRKTFFTDHRGLNHVLLRLRREHPPGVYEIHYDLPKNLPHWEATTTPTGVTLVRKYATAYYHDALSSAPS